MQSIVGAYYAKLCTLRFFHGYSFEQELFFSNKSRDGIDHGDMGLLPMAYTEHVVIMCMALLFSSYDEYCLMYESPDVICFARKFDIAMEVPLV